MENIVQRNFRKLFHVAPTMVQGSSTGYLGRSGSAEHEVGAHIQPQSWRFANGQDGKPFSFPPLVQDGDSQSGSCTTPIPSKHFKCFARESRNR